MNNIRRTRPTPGEKILQPYTQKTFYTEINVQIATGVPIPDDSQISRNNLVYRKLYVGFYDTEQNCLRGNSCVIPGTWNSYYEDRWYFDQSLNYERLSTPANALANYFIEIHPQENIIYVQMVDYDKIRDRSLHLVFEFVLHVKLNKQNSKAFQPDVEISCCYGMIPLE